MNSSLTNLIAKKNHMATTNRNPRLIFRRLVATALAAIAIVGNPDAPARRAYAAPADITSTAAPALGKDAPAGAAIKGNEASVSGQTGALQYSYPITVPPGRNGMAPSLALSYSSQAPIYGGIAAGWSLDVPMIKTDVSKGILRTEGGMADAQDVIAGVDIRKNDLFVSTMAGGRPLVATTEALDANVYKTYRAKNDSSFARYDRMNPNHPYRWQVRSPDGHTYLYGETANIWTCDITDGYAPLTSHIDEFGNVVKYFYGGIASNNPTECDLVKIEYGENPSLAPSGVIGRVTFTYSEPHRCSAAVNGVASTEYIGSQSDYRDSKKRYSGIRPLSTITVESFGHPTDRNTRTISLTQNWAGTSSVSTDYSEMATCTGEFAPYRQLTAISETVAATGRATVSLPTVTFGYGTANIQRTTPTTLATARRPVAQGFRYLTKIWPLVKKMTLDYNGDGRPDLLEIDENDEANCKVDWKATRPVGGYKCHRFYCLDCHGQMETPSDLAVTSAVSMHKGHISKIEPVPPAI
jgi:hypothetical protein